MKITVQILLFLILTLGVGSRATAQATSPARKPIVAVATITDNSNSGQAEALKTMIQTAVTGTGKFRIIERDFAQLDSEQALARSGRVTTNRPQRSGGYEGVDFIVYGTLTAASGGREGDSGADMGRAMAQAMFGVPLGGNGGACNKAVATIAVDVKIVDTVTGEVKFAKQLTERASSGTTCSGTANLDLTSTIRSIANQIATGLTITMYPIKVAAVQSDGVFVLNYGEGALTVGAVLGVYDEGPKILDPDTGAVLTSEGSELGRIRVTEVTTRFSKALPVSPFATTPPNGTIVRVVADQRVERQSKRN
jgi:hypothetical protein